MIAVLYREGNYLEKDIEKSIKIFKKLNNHILSYKSLGDTFFYKKYNVINYEKALNYYFDCLNYDLDKLPGNFHRQLLKSYDTYVKSIKLECTEMIFRFYRDGLHVEKNIDKAIEILNNSRKKDEFSSIDILLADIYFFKNI